MLELILMGIAAYLIIGVVLFVLSLIIHALFLFIHF